MSKVANALGVSNAAVFDSTGKVVATVGGFSLGDDVSSVACVQDALGGNSSSTIDKGPNSDFEVMVALPVESNGSVVGGIMLSHDLTDNAFVDDTQSWTGTTYEFTIFKDDVRVATTVKDSSGNRIVGTTMSEKIAQIVLKDGKEYTGRAAIAGKKYNVVYEPIQAADGSVIGALFSGYDLTSYFRGIITSIALCCVLSLAIVALVVILIGRFMRKRLRHPLENVVSAVDDIAEGKMSAKTSDTLAALATKDEIGQLARSMEQAVSSVRKISDDTQYLEAALQRNDLTVSVNTDSHRGIYKMIADVVNRLFNEIVTDMKEVSTIAKQIDSSTIQVAEAAQTLAQGSTEQAGSVEELASTINSIVSQVDQNAASAKQAFQASQEAETQVMSSNEQMNSMMSAMDEISKTSQQISVIVKTIDDLAFQTNLLALNAAVEAARAGAQGKGFAVVADEVQNLAGKSAAAAKSTAELIESALSAVKKGTDFARNAEEGLKGVVGKTTQVNEMVSKITAATDTEAEMLNQVSEGIDQISIVVQKNSGIAEETAAASQGLTAETKKLNDMVGRYKFN